jgi:hypothetical protein
MSAVILHLFTLTPEQCLDKEKVEMVQILHKIRRFNSSNQIHFQFWITFFLTLSIRGQSSQMSNINVKNTFISPAGEKFWGVKNTEL